LIAPPPLSAAARADLRACLAAIDRRERAAAVALARSLASAAERSARFAGVRLLYLLRLYQEAIDSLREHLGSNAEDLYARRLLYSLLKRLRFEQEADAVLGNLLQMADDARVHEAAALHYQGKGEPRAALKHLERVIRAKADAGRHYLTQLTLAIRAGDLYTARRAAADALQREPARWLEIVDRLLEAGFFDMVESEAKRRADDPEAGAVLAEIALFRGSWSEAYEQASSAHRRAPDCERAMVAMLGASVMSGDLDRAEQDLRRWTGASGPTLRTWLSELLWRRGDLEGARRELNRIQNEIRDYMAAKLLWVLVKGKLDDERYVTTTAYDGLLEGQLQAYGIEPRIEKGVLDSNELRAAATEILERMLGNRSPFPSVVSDGRLLPIRIPPSPRHRAAEVQHRARYVGLDRVKEEIVAELARIGPHPIAECYEAELYLWSGDYDIARAKFEKILAAASQTTWAWIGLGASQTLLGDAARLPGRSDAAPRPTRRRRCRARRGLRDAAGPRRRLGAALSDRARARQCRAMRCDLRSSRRRRARPALRCRARRRHRGLVAGTAAVPRNAAPPRRAIAGTDARQPLVDLPDLDRAGDRRGTQLPAPASRHDGGLGSVGATKFGRALTTAASAKLRCAGPERSPSVHLEIERVVR
jgi:tetratricopeptide (TPR) repeat protein